MDGAERDGSQNSWQPFNDGYGRDAAYRRVARTGHGLIIGRTLLAAIAKLQLP